MRLRSMYHLISSGISAGCSLSGSFTKLSRIFFFSAGIFCDRDIRDKGPNNGAQRLSLPPPAIGWINSNIKKTFVCVNNKKARSSWNRAGLDNYQNAIGGIMSPISSFSLL